MSRAVEVSRIIDVFEPVVELPAKECFHRPVEMPESQSFAPGEAREIERPLAPATVANEQALTSTRTSSPPLALEYVVLPNTLDPRVVLLREPTSERARSYRLLRHRLLSDSDPRIIAVTSAFPGEGKTTCALNLALAIAEDSMTRVLLLDANLRRPALSQILHFVPSESLFENAARLTNVGPPYPVVSLSGTRLHVAAVRNAPLETGRLDRTLFALILDDLRYAYDYIVIDAAAVLESGDVDVIGECSSGVIVTARAGRSRKDGIRRAIAQLAPTRVLGTVLIDT